MQIAFVLALLVLAIVNFALEWMAVEIFSLLLMGALVVGGVLTAHQASMGFANSAVIMIAGVMLLTGGIIHNGAADYIALRILKYAGRSERRMGALLLFAENVLSSVINNVAATAMFIPVAEGMARHYRTNRAKYLLPIAFASMTGGMCTLIGTSTNVAVAGALEQHGFAPLGFFELAPIGVTVALLGIGYLLWATPRLLRLEPEKEALEAFGLKDFLFEVVVGDGAALVGQSMSQSDLGTTLGLNVLAIMRGPERILAPRFSDVIRPGDILLVEGRADTIPAIRNRRGLEIKSMPVPDWNDLKSAKIKLMEATVSYNSRFIGKTLKEIDFRRHYNLSVLAIHRNEHVALDKVGKLALRAGDVLLIYGTEDMFARLEAEPTVLLVEHAVPPHVDMRKALLATLVLFGAIVAATFGWLDAPMGFLLGSAVVMALGCLPPAQAGNYLNLRFLVMLAAMASLGLAMETSGAARFVADGIISLCPDDSPLLLMSVFFFLTVAMTQPLSNAAAALLVLPIALSAAGTLAIDPRSFAIAVTVAASCSFITPFEPACLLVYGTGRYRFREFILLGSGLTFIAYLVSLVLIPILWPFRAA